MEYLMEHPIIMGGELTTMRPVGGVVNRVAIVQRDDWQWHIEVNVSWRGNETLIVGHFDKVKIRLFKRSAFAQYLVQSRFGFVPEIVIRPMKGAPLPERFA